MAEGTRKQWGIVADSACDLFHDDYTDDIVEFTTIPFTLTVGDRDYVDTEDLDVDVMLEDMESTPTASHTACPSPAAFVAACEKAASNIIITISGSLSGSFESASLAKRLLVERDPEAAVLVLDSFSTGPGQAIIIEQLKKWMDQGLTMPAITTKAAEAIANTRTVFALSSFDNLVKNGRMGRIAGFLANKLGMWGVGIASELGEIKIKGKARGKNKCLTMILEDMKARGYAGKEVIISHCHNGEMAQLLKDKISEHWQSAQITILKTRGLDSFYAERGGLIISYLS